MPHRSGSCRSASPRSPDDPGPGRGAPRGLPVMRARRRSSARSSPTPARPGRAGRAPRLPDRRRRGRGRLALAACSSSSSSRAPAGSSGAAAGATRRRLRVRQRWVRRGPEGRGAGHGAGEPGGRRLQAALTAATAGKLGTVPPAVATFVQTAMSQHRTTPRRGTRALRRRGARDHRRAALEPGRDPQGARRGHHVGGVAKPGPGAGESGRADVPVRRRERLERGGIATAASIAPVEAMHAAILQFVLGQYPVPDDFLGTSKAASPSLLTV
jgi:hypothetical protein